MKKKTIEIKELEKKYYLCSIKTEQMAEIFRNLMAFAGTFSLIAAVVMMVLHGLIAIISHKKEMSNRQERYIVYIGIAVALLLIPFYYFPA